MTVALRRPSRRRAVGPLLVLAVLLGSAAACSDDGGEDATEFSTGFEDQGCDAEPAPEVPADLDAFTQQTLAVRSGAGDEVVSCVLVADTSAERAQGLMQVTDLGGHAGMLFVFEQPVDGAFHMLDTPMPLSIAWFSASGELVSTADMEPCVDERAEADECPSYPAGGEFSYAVEVPQGELEAIGIDGPDAVLEVDQV